MKTYKVKTGSPVLLNAFDEILITTFIKEAVRKHQLKVLAYNICKDHVHILLQTKQEKLSEAVRKLKGFSAKKYKHHLNIFPKETFHLWAQKYHFKRINTPEQLVAVIRYIDYNRVKHQLPQNPNLKPLIRTMVSGRSTLLSEAL